MPVPRETIIRSGSCAGCGTKTSRLRLCTRCRGVGYCSKLCQAKHWSALHKAHCIPTRSSGRLPLGELIQEKFELTRSESPRSCTKCSSPLESFRTRIWLPPKVLVVHLDRRHKVYGKISTCAIFFSLFSDTATRRPVEYPITSFDLRSCANLGNPSTSTVFDLKAVVEHTGDCRNTFFSGHFSAVVYNDADCHWYRACDVRTVRCDANDAATADAYVLYYVQRS